MIHPLFGHPLAKDLPPVIYLDFCLGQSFNTGTWFVDSWFMAGPMVAERVALLMNGDQTMGKWIAHWAE